MARLLTPTAVLAVLLLAAGCGTGGGGRTGDDAIPVPGLGAPEGQGLVGPAPGELQLVAPTLAPVGTEVPAVGTCIGARVGFDEYQYERQVGDAVDCGLDHQGVVVGVEGFDPGYLAQTTSIPTRPDQLADQDVFRVLQTAVPGCRAQVEAVADHALSLGGDLRRVWSLTPEVRLPTAAQWEAGERWAACLLFAPALEPVAGGVDVLALRADVPLPASLQSCTTTVGDAVACAAGAARQRFADLPVTTAQTPPPRTPFDDATRAELGEVCRGVLQVVDPDLAAADWVRVSVDTRTDPLLATAESGEDVVGARCSVVNRNVGAGLQAVLP